MKKKTIIIILILIILIAGVFLILFTTTNLFAGRAVENIYTYTKAICNESKFCQDYEISCAGEELIEIKPLTGAAVQQSDEWEDPRTQEQINELCSQD